MNRFMRAELSLAELILSGVITNGDFQFEVSSGLQRPLLNTAFRFGTRGQRGCTTLLVHSSRGVWWAHFWEVPSFTYLSPVDGPIFYERQFNSDVIQVLENGCIFPQEPGRISGLGCYASDEEGQPGWFKEEYHPRAMIFTPKPAVRHLNKQDPIAYPEQIQRMKDKVRELIPGIDIRVKPYNTEWALQDNPAYAKGKLLF
ncbi:hypothetical protein FQN57_000133 [Myotisia sp. PD_48]|nr:hypothetical protein FQN57_000133 [Myotisia sp. PD_48]